jgi:molybdopterin/thiamine biosynthesis adenylyltransferase
MNEQEWRARRNSRSLRYAERVLDPGRWIILQCDATYADRYDGQVALLTAANLFARMTPAVVLDVPSAPLVSALPWAGQDLPGFLLDTMFKADPYGNFHRRARNNGDYVIHFGAEGAPFITHGSGWNLYLGPEPSPLTRSVAANPIGSAMAAIIAAATAFNSNLAGSSETVLLNALNWQPAIVENGVAEFGQETELGDLWIVGTGSVGTAILYFLTLATRNFSTSLFDMDIVKIHNLDRSPVFAAEQVGMAKVQATEAWLRRAGVSCINSDQQALDESDLWRKREEGRPDILVAAANERNVRSVIETGFPPIQVYGTTGKNWQVAMIRHVPMKDPCSLCLFPEMDFVATECATGEINAAPCDDEKTKMDAALPFLSFAAGSMAAAEILKLGLPDYPFTSNRVVLNTQPTVKTVGAALAQREGCICEHRSEDVHSRMITGSRFAVFSVN